MQGTEQFEKVTSNLIQACDEINQLTRDGLNVAIQSATTATKGCEEIYNTVGNLVKYNLTTSAEASKAVMGAKTAREALELQNNLVKEGFAFFMAEMNRISEIFSRVSQDALNPVAEHVNTTMTKVTKIAKVSKAA